MEEFEKHSNRLGVILLAIAVCLLAWKSWEHSDHIAALERITNVKEDK